MKKSKIQFYVIALLGCTMSTAQFHTLDLPKSSNYVLEKQTLGVTDIEIEYHSPQVRGRDVWNDSNVIPQNGDPIPWRIGANMNTTISFSTDVQINGNDLSAGKYGLHMIPNGNEFEILFAHNNDQWGSYYLNLDEDISLRVKGTGEPCAFSEKLDFEFLPKSEDELIMGIEWADKRIPFTISIDLNETVLASLRSELRGINTYRWEAWNDAASWCHDRDVNLKEALEWANRSIEGGSGGFAANKNATNTMTKAKIERKLGMESEFQKTVNEILDLDFSAHDSNEIVFYLLGEDDDELALSFAKKANEKFDNVWYVKLNLGVAYYANEDTKKAEKFIIQSKEMSPDAYKERIEALLSKVKDGSYEI